MPSPLGHVLGGAAAGWLVAGRTPNPAPLRLGRVVLPGWTRDLALYGAIAAAPDLDLLVGSHSTYTHSVGAVVVAFVAALIVKGGHLRAALAVAAAWGSHLLLDWLGSDTSPPIGILALWPLSGDHYQSSLHVFEAISRRYWMGSQFVAQNVKAIAREIVILGPVVLLAYAFSARWVAREDAKARRR